MTYLRMWLAFALAFACSLARATPPATLADLTSAIDFTTASAALLAVALAVIAFKVVKQGGMIVLRFIGWAK